MKSFDVKWEEVHNSREWGKYPNEEVIRFVARNYYKKDRKSIKILDAGCGLGAVAWFLARENFDAYAFDGSKSAIEKTKKRFEDEKLNCQFEVEDALELSYDEKIFDAIIDSGMLTSNTTDNIRNILKNYYKILKKGGKVFSTTLFEIGMDGYGTGEEIEEHTYRNLTKGCAQDIGTIHFFDKNQINEFWSEVGFKDIKIDYITRTDSGGKIEARYFIVEAQK